MENVRAAPLERWFLRSSEERERRSSERANGLSLSTVIVVGFYCRRHRRRRWQRCHDNLPGGHSFDGIADNNKRSESVSLSAVPIRLQALQRRSGSILYFLSVAG